MSEQPAVGMDSQQGLGSLPLAGRAALVTGSARNIGRAIAVALAREGAAVMINARASRAEAERVVDSIRAEGGRAELMLADVTDPAAAQALVTGTFAAFGRLDILVNNAAVRRETPLEALELAEWREVVSSILDATYLCSRAALPHLKAAARGTIVNIGGLSAHLGATGRAHVVAAKAGVVGLTRALAHELAPHGITVNCVVPGLIETERRSAGTRATPAHHAIARALVDRRGTSEEVAAAVCFLCRPEARYITGQVIHVNGGAYLGA